MTSQAATPAQPDITVSIVSYNTRELLRACLHSLLARHEAGEVTLEIAVADNGSPDGSIEMVQREFPAVRLTAIGRNIGYGRANNAALEAAQGRYYLVLNSDTEVEAGALAAMRDFMDEHPKIGCVGAQLILPGGDIQGSCAGDPSLRAFFWEQTYLNKLLPRHPVFGAYFKSDWDHFSRREVEQVCGACLFVRGEAFRAIGGFDPAYFMYFEDTDFCVRLRRAGWPIWFVPEARIRHHMGASSSGEWRQRARMVAAYNKSRYYYFTRNEGAMRGRLLKAIVLLGAALRLLAWSARRVVDAARRSKTSSGRNAEQVRLFRDVLRRTSRMTAEAETRD